MVVEKRRVQGGNRKNEGLVEKADNVSQYGN
jgi:hypothetical protein